MTEERDPKPAEEPSVVATAARQRKKRKWDQPAEALISAGLSVTGTLSLASISQSSAAIIQKLTQPKIQDELIAREIVINDAEPTIRYKLTKRQTQEEIQRSTGAVVITRGKFQPPNALPDSEKPLYLHISAGAHLKDTAERIIAVDLAASMVEDILKHGLNSLPASTPFHSTMSSGQAHAAQPLSACLYLGFETDPSLNIAARIRGPNDMYINHIMNETGATVVLRGRGSGILENSSVEEAQQPLHLYLSSTNTKCLEAARSLAENLLDTISAECNTSRISSCKAYSAVPPPQQLLAGVQNSVEGLGVNTNPVARMAAGSTPALTANGSSSTTVPLPGSMLSSGVVPNYSSPQLPIVSYSYPSVTGGTRYSGYGGIYPHATPLQQVALALRKTPSLTTPGQASTACIPAGFASAACAASMPSKPTSSSIAELEKKPPQRRKFQESSAASEDAAIHHQNLLQGSERPKPYSRDSNARNISTMPPPKKLVQTESSGMPPPPRTMPPPPPPKFNASKSPPLPPSKFSSLGSGSRDEKGQYPFMMKTSEDPVPDTLLKLVEYGEEDDDTDGPGEESVRSNLARKPSSKPFWAV